MIMPVTYTPCEAQQQIVASDVDTVERTRRPPNRPAGVPATERAEP